jgi:hypothetical protein
MVPQADQWAVGAAEDDGIRSDASIDSLRDGVIDYLRGKRRQVSEV